MVFIFGNFDRIFGPLCLNTCLCLLVTHSAILTNHVFLPKERDGLLQENENLQLAIKDTKQDTQHMLELLERSDKERKRLAEKNAKLTVTGRLFMTKR